MKRIAVGVCRWARATSPGSKSWIAAIMVLVVAQRPSRPGLNSWSARRSSPTGTASPASRTSASISDAFHMYGIAFGSGCLVIWLASSQRPYMWAACIFSWNSFSAAVATGRVIAVLLLRRRRLQIVELERVLSEDLRLHARLQVLALQELVDGVRPLAVPVRVVRGVDDVVLADPAGHVRDCLFLGLAREVGAATRHVFARLGLAERRVPRALLELAVHVLHEERHPACARFHETDAQPLDLLEEPAVDAADHRDHLLRRVGPRVHRQEVAEAIRIARLASRGMHADGHTQALGLFVDRPEERIGHVSAGDEGREHQPDEPQLRDGPIELTRRLGWIEIRHDRHTLQAIGSRLAPVGHEVVVSPAQSRLIVGLADFADPERGCGIEKREVDSFLTQIGQHLLRRVGVAPHVAVGRLAPVPLGAWEEGNATTVLLGQVLLIATVREVHDMA